MPFQIIREDIRKIQVDAVVDPTDEFYSGSGGTDEKIHLAAGKKLDEACSKLNPLKAGEAVLTSSFDMTNTKYIIHTHGPRYIDGKQDEEKLLYGCYKNSLNIAKEKKLKSIAFPLISSGTFGFPKGQALKTATDAITDYLLDSELFIYLLVYDDESFDTSNKLFIGVKDYIQKHLNPEKTDRRLRNSENQRMISSGLIEEKIILHEIKSKSLPKKVDEKFKPDVSFGEYLVSLIDARGLKDKDVYMDSNMSKQLFNDIKNDRHAVKKENVCALAFGLKMNITDTMELLKHAGYTLSTNNTFDLIIRYCLKNKVDIINTNILLYENDQVQLGARNLKSDKEIAKRSK